jgi:PAS domain S-box-containing protein
VGKAFFGPEWKAKREDGSPCSGEESPIARAIATRQRVCGEVIGVNRPGTQDRVWVLVNAEPLLTADRSVVEVICSFTDITHQRLAEEELRSTEERFRKVFAHAATGMNLQNLEGVYLEVNRAFCEITGYEECELIGANCRSITHPEDLARDLFGMEELLAGRIPSLVIKKRYLSKDGRVVWVRNSVSLLRDSEGAPPNVIVLVEDITESKQAEEALRASEERFRKVFAHASTGMTLQDFEGKFLEVNQAFCDITGYDERELLGADYRSITHPDDMAGTNARIEELLAGESPSFVTEKRYVRKDRRPVWVRNSVSLLGNGKPPRIISLVEDITERKQAEEALRQLSGQLLKAQDEERRRLARELHDGTAQSIAALGLNLSLVRDSSAALDARAQKALNQSVELADQCIRELRTLSYLLHPPMLEDCGLASALAGYADGFAERSGIAVKLDLAPDLGRLPQEVELMLFRMVQESLTNIHRHSGSRTATIRLARYPQDIVLEVRDQGSGIGKPDREGAPDMRIGVGIAGMKERVRQIGGTLQIRSRPGGTDVEVVVPLYDPYR